MTKYLEWDYDNPKHRSRRRRQLLPLEGEVLGPEPEVEPRIHVTVEHRHVNQRQPNILPRLVTIAAFVVVLALILVRSPGALDHACRAYPRTFLDCRRGSCCGAGYHRMARA